MQDYIAISVAKDITWHMGHRVWTQNLEQQKLNKCIRLHGHEYKLELQLITSLEAFVSKHTDFRTGMILDFTVMNRLKHFIDDYLDHRTMLDIQDPMLPELLLPTIVSAINTETDICLRFIIPEHIVAAYLQLKQFEIAKPMHMATWTLVYKIRQSYTISDILDSLRYIMSIVGKAVKSVYTGTMPILTIESVQEANDNSNPLIDTYVLSTFVPTAENLAIFFKTVCQNIFSVLTQSQDNTIHQLDKLFNTLKQTIENELNTEHLLLIDARFDSQKYVTLLERLIKNLPTQYKHIYAVNTVVWETSKAKASVFTTDAIQK